MAVELSGGRDAMTFGTLNVRQKGPVAFAGIAAPPMNLLGPDLVRDLVSFIQGAEADHEAQVVVFHSADPDYFISHVDVTRISEYREQAAKLTGEASLGLLFRYLSTSRLITIAQIEGRVVTVKAHRGQVMRKMKADSLADLVTIAGKQGERSPWHHANIDQTGALPRRP